MALTDGNTNDMVMPVAPMYGGGNGGFGGFGNDGWWIILLFILLGNNGWGNGFGGGFDGGLYPWMNNSQNINNGFRDQMLNTTINGIQNDITAGFGDVQNSLCAGFAGVNAAITNAQIADMQQAFAQQTATTQGFNNVQTQLAQCCCDNRAAISDLKYTVATEACADRSAVNDATQRILDQLCQDKIDAKNEKIAELQNALTMAELRANNNQQTQTLLTDNLAQTNALEQYLAPVPRPAYIVQNPNCCVQNTCGCGSF